MMRINASDEYEQQEIVKDAIESEEIKNRQMTEEAKRTQNQEEWDRMIALERD